MPEEGRKLEDNPHWWVWIKWVVQILNMLLTLLEQGSAEQKEMAVRELKRLFTG